MGFSQFLGNIGNVGQQLYEQDLMVSNPDAFGLLQEKKLGDLRRQELEDRRAERTQELSNQRTLRGALGNLAPQLAERTGIPEEVLGSLIESGVGVDGLKQLGNLASGSETVDPSAVREFEFFQSLQPEEKENFLKVKRAQQILNLGGTQQVLSPLGGAGEEFEVTPKPEQMPEFRGEQAESTALGAARGAAKIELADLESIKPKLDNVVTKLSELSKTATYSKPAKVWADAQRALGNEVSQGDIDRRSYISIVDNEILPLLRQTFGAAFTEAEGRTLKATLGDPDATPAEKQAVLDSFMDNKTTQIDAQRRKVGLLGGEKTKGATPSAQQGDLTPDETKELEGLRAKYGR